MPTLIQTVEDHLKYQLGTMVFQLVAQGVELDKRAQQVTDLEAKLAKMVPAGAHNGDGAV